MAAFGLRRARREVKIPRIIHRIWLGGDPLRDEFDHYGDTWRNHHPGWEMRLWTEDDLPELGLTEALARGRHQAERADVLRYELLERFGGVYVDIDFECMRSLEPLLDGVEAFAAFQMARTGVQRHARSGARSSSFRTGQS